jgi:hypothetical protein
MALDVDRNKTEKVFLGTNFPPYLLLAIPVILLYTPIVESFFPKYRSTVHFFLLFAVMAALSLLLYFRVLTTHSVIHPTTFIPALNLAFTLILTLRALFFTRLDRSCWSFILIATCLYVMSCVGPMSNIEHFHTIERSLLTNASIALTVYCMMYIFAADNLEIFQGVIGLVIPIVSFTLTIGLLNKNYYLLVISFLLVVLAALDHYQTSYLLIPISISVAFLGMKISLIRIIYMLITGVYCILISTTELFFYLLSLSSNKGYDNVGLRELFARIAYSFYKNHILFGGEYENPINVTVVNAGQKAILPLHSDALVYLVASGIIGWGFLNLTLLTVLYRIWNNEMNSLSLGLVAGLISAYLTGIFSSLFGSTALIFIISLTFLHSSSNLKIRNHSD